MRGLLDAGTDCRARNWRSRRVEGLPSLTEDPWARAAGVGETLDPVQPAEVVDDPYERACLGRSGPCRFRAGRFGNRTRCHGAAGTRRRTGREPLAAGRPRNGAGRRARAARGPAARGGAASWSGGRRRSPGPTRSAGAAGRPAAVLGSGGGVG
nr:DUF6397 family protein [Streptomyces sp. NBC_00995]